MAETVADSVAGCDVRERVCGIIDVRQMVEVAGCENAVLE